MKTTRLVLLFLVIAGCGESSPLVAAIGQPVDCVLHGPTVSPATATLRAGDTLRVKASPAPCTSGTVSFQWATSNAAVADVDSAGLVRARGQGTATIVASLTRDLAVKGAMVVNVVP